MKAFLHPLACLLLAFAIASADTSFQIGWEQPVRGTSASDLALGDIDGDGDVDAVITHFTHPGSVFINDGNGNFSPNATTAPILSATTCQLGDLDGDGDLDLFIGRPNNPGRVYFNDGHGNFTAGTQNLGFTTAGKSLLHDIDGDGDLDIVIPSNNFETPSKIWLNNGGGTFTDSGIDFDTSYATCVAIADLNNDGRADLVFGCNGSDKIFFRNSNGTYTASTQNFDIATNTMAVAIADLNHDGRPDLWFARGSAPPFAQSDVVWFNNGNGTFTKSTQALGGEFSVSVLLTDFDLDGDLDAVVGTVNGQPNKIWLNNGSGTFALSPIDSGKDRFSAIRSADLDGDSDLDFFFAVNGNPSIVWKRVPPAQGGPIVDSGQRLGSAAALHAAQGDFDGDGKIDVAIAGNLGNIRILRNDGTGSFTDSLPSLFNGEGNATHHLAVADFDGDGDLDIYAVNAFYSNGADRRDVLWLNDGTGRFTASSQTFADSEGRSALVLDVDNDGDHDIIVGNLGEQDKLLRNNGSGIFTVTDVLDSGNTQALAAGYFNNDAHLDIVIGKHNQHNTVWFGNGSGGFTDSGQSLGNQSTTSVILKDFNGDTHLDIFFCNATSGSKLYLNNGSGTFALSSANFSTQPTRDAVAFDADGDGDFDIWSGNGVYSTAPDQLWINNGNASFTLSGTFGTRAAGGIAAADFNGDGRIEIFEASYDGDHILWSRGLPPLDEVRQYAASFGLTGTDIDPLEDPDGDGILNYEEMAFNMNPGIPDAQHIPPFTGGSTGLPNIRVEISGSQKTFVAETIRRIGSQTLDYRLEVSPDLDFATVPPGVIVTSHDINSIYQRATYRYIVPGTPPRMFGRFRVVYEP